MSPRPLARIGLRRSRSELAASASVSASIICHAGRQLGDAAHALDGGDLRALRRAARRLEAGRELLRLALATLDEVIARGTE